MKRLIGLTALGVLLLAPLSARAQYYVPAPTVSYYSAPPVVSYYSAPAVSYYSAPAVSYYSAPAVSYYSAPAVSYYAPAPTTVSSYRYGLLGRRGVTTVTYGAPGYVAPAPVYTQSSYYYAPVFPRLYYGPGYYP